MHAAVNVVANGKDDDPRVCGIKLRANEIQTASNAALALEIVNQPAEWDVLGKFLGHGVLTEAANGRRVPRIHSLYEGMQMAFQTVR